MTEPESARNAVQTQARDAARGAFLSEVEALALGYAERRGGIAAGLARIRSGLSEVLGVLGTIDDIRQMAMAGFEAMTTERRITYRVAAAHGFGYWTFQHQNPPRPHNPPNALLVRARASDARDRRTARTIGNPNYSSDGGLTSADWNNIWRRGAINTINSTQDRLRSQVRRGVAERTLRERLGNQAQISGQSPQVIADQYRVVVICPQFANNPSFAAASFLGILLKGAPDLERDATLREYARFPYAQAARAS